MDNRLRCHTENPDHCIISLAESKWYCMKLIDLRNGTPNITTTSVPRVNSQRRTSQNTKSIRIRCGFLPRTVVTFHRSVWTGQSKTEVLCGWYGRSAQRTIVWAAGNKNPSIAWLSWTRSGIVWLCSTSRHSMSSTMNTIFQYRSFCQTPLPSMRNARVRICARTLNRQNSFSEDLISDTYLNSIGIFLWRSNQGIKKAIKT